MFKYHLMR